MQALDAGGESETALGHLLVGSGASVANVVLHGWLGHGDHDDVLGSGALAAAVFGHGFDASFGDSLAKDGGIDG